LIVSCGQAISTFQFTCENSLTAETGKVLISMKTYICVICGYIYDEATGDPDHGLVPGTRWQDIPDNWKCPDCSAMKEDFEMVEV
jgi:rubredoxin